MRQDDSTLLSEASNSTFQSFSNFPEYQFKTIQLNTATGHVLAQMDLPAVKEISTEEVIHFYFQDDSSEIIIPDQPNLTEFKVYLRSNNYLRQERVFHSFFQENSEENTSDSLFSSFIFSSSISTYKMTYFNQKDFIRLHFMLITKRG